ncbi:Protein CBG05693 [Caenorhabditis briggsae]|uniref:Uncharacterized protein n=2 Tax=Caenorhabditis briggsae TaxID=6238 RepID=A0AAE9JQP9_CAEBR|nr:Protein CBG05693 [Caenorhabditis briggsae]ULT92870.1 hypothetical protein L3Y34_010154 [Caenorhabditis briggsae]UMM38614.1 hypothetical protein L5515_009955 [Caenorhabditis briggsae]CAP26126.1 Protein CBG05693 [Caenorhabditis briggsae]
MDFREVWENTPLIDETIPHVVAAKTCAQDLKQAEDNCVYLLATSIFLLVLNVFSLLIFNRHAIVKLYRSRFQPLPSSETASSVFRGAFDQDSIDLKG